MIKQFYTKKQLKYIILLKQIKKVTMFYIVFSCVQRKNYFKLDNIFFLVKRELQFLNQKLLKTSSYITETPHQEDNIILLIKGNYCFLPNQIQLVHKDKVITSFLNQNINFYKRFYSLLKLSSLEKN